MFKHSATFGIVSSLLCPMLTPAFAASAKTKPHLEKKQSDTNKPDILWVVKFAPDLANYHTAPTRMTASGYVTHYDVFNAQQFNGLICRLLSPANKTDGDFMRLKSLIAYKLLQSNDQAAMLEICKRNEEDMKTVTGLLERGKKERDNAKKRWQQCVETVEADNPQFYESEDMTQSEEELSKPDPTEAVCRPQFDTWQKILKSRIETEQNISQKFLINFRTLRPKGITITANINLSIVTTPPAP